jgi:hypothetical protein
MVNKEIVNADFQAKNCPASRSGATRNVVASRSKPAPRKSTLLNVSLERSALTPRYLSAFSWYGNEMGDRIAELQLTELLKVHCKTS